MSQKTLLRSLALLLMTLIGIGVFLMIALPRMNSSNSIEPMVELETEHSENLYAEFNIPEFELVDRNGETITHEALDGHYTVVDFFFTSCPLWCPGMTQSMLQVQRATAGTDLRFMSISIDGSVDTPEVIDAYATRYNSDAERWDYVTGDPEVIATMVMDGLKFDLGDPDETEDTGRLINHPTRLILLGPDRRVVGLYRYNDPDEVEELIADALKLVQ